MRTNYRVLICAAVLPFLAVSCKAVLSEKEMDSILASKHATRDSLQEKLDSYSNWRVSNRTDPMDDTKSFTASTLSVYEDESDYTPASLIVRCKHAVVDIFVNNSRMISGSSGVLMRFDDLPAEKHDMDMSTDDLALFVRARRITPTLRSLRSADSLQVRFQTYSSGAVTRKFKLGADGRQAIDSVTSACGVRVN